MSSFCPNLDKNNSSQNEFYLNCAFKYISSEPEKLDNIDASYINEINNIEEPILRHIFIYFAYYYINGYYYFKDSVQLYRSDACKYLTRWLLEKKDLFTYGKNCPKKIDLWDNKIKNLLVMLKDEYTLPNTTEKTAWCNINSLTLKTEYPQGFKLPDCEESTTQKSSSTCPPPVPDKTICNCPQIEDPAIPQPQDQPQEVDRTKNLAVTSGFTAVGTLGTLFFLYRFTPMASWFRRPGMSNIGTGLYMDQGGADSFLRMQGGDGGNNLFYHPSV